MGTRDCHPDVVTSMVGEVLKNGLKQVVIGAIAGNREDSARWFSRHRITPCEVAMVSRRRQH